MVRALLWKEHCDRNHEHSCARLYIFRDEDYLLSQRLLHGSVAMCHGATPTTKAVRAPMHGRYEAGIYFAM